MTPRRFLSIIKSSFERRLFSPDSNKEIIDEFHKFFYDSHTYTKTTWLGQFASKCPFDLFVYQDILYELQPDIIIESGTAAGGTTYFLGSICDLIGKGKIITIDIKKEKLKKHKRAIYLIGSSTDEKIVNYIKKQIKPNHKILVILDSAHYKEHVLNELRIYSKLITKGSYLIVEDTNLNGNPIFPTYGPGPNEALKEFLKENSDFVIDRTREKFFLSFNPRGYLKKVR